MSANFSIAPYSRQLREPFSYGASSLATRNGLVIRRGSLYCEASPLPSHSLDSFDEVLSALTHATNTSLEEALRHEEVRRKLPASLRFALEGLLAQETGAPFSPVRTNALLRWEGAASMRKLIATLAAEDFLHFKLKLPGTHWEELAGLIQEFPSLRFRLDANGMLNAQGLEDLLLLLDKPSLRQSIDYIEEPFAAVWQQKSFLGSPVALAADESAHDAVSALQLLEQPNPPAVFVIKPTVYGALYSLSGLLSSLASAGARTVLTSSMESEPGRRAILAFLGSQSLPPAGISTGFIYKKNFLPDRALWETFPVSSQGEKEWLRSLSWRDLP